MTKYENECVGCKDLGNPCYGDSCPNRHVKRLYCDECGDISDKLYLYNDMELCKRCLLNTMPVIKND